MFKYLNQLSKLQITVLVLTIVNTFFLFVALITPAWQVAEDSDTKRNIQSGLWIYCPEFSQCWYTFSDNFVNDYERAEVCRFFMISDCRIKLIRAPYFFGWHYAVLYLILIALKLNVLSIIFLVIAIFSRKFSRCLIVLFDIGVSLSFLLTFIGLIVFVVNAEMLESKYLIGPKKVHEKYYGYSFYLACLSVFIMMFTIIGAILLTICVFYKNNINQTNDINNFTNKRTSNYVQNLNQQNKKFQMTNENLLQNTLINKNVPKYYSPGSNMVIPTRTFLSY